MLEQEPEQEKELSEQEIHDAIHYAHRLIANNTKFHETDDTFKDLELGTLSSEKIEQAKEEVVIKRIEREIKRIEREAIIQKIDDWIVFASIKIGGLISVIIGSIEVISPNLLPLTLPASFPPIMLATVGIVLLGGKRAISLLRDFFNAIPTEKER
ncbi:MAG: hypothetical protein F6J87_19395 [Spirulina sp. SIO3F2]|nr:hypothetical protein [Spirulina sp. SIO3F2]